MSEISVSGVSKNTLDKKTRIKSIIGGSAGNLVEWYDWFAYSMFTLYFARSFFQQVIKR